MKLLRKQLSDYNAGDVEWARRRAPSVHAEADRIIKALEANDIPFGASEPAWYCAACALLERARAAGYYDSHTT